MVNEGDVILVKTASVGKCTIYTSSLPATVNPQFVVFKDVNCSNRFLYYNLQSDYIQKQIKLSCMGSVIPTLTQGEILSYRIPLPSLADQERIADYLDAKCASIDDVIAKTNESIEEYKKLKQAVITEAVTKGVRGKRPMKDSGLDWVGQIPKEWRKARVKQVASRVTDGAHVSPETDNGEFDFVSTVNVDDFGNIDYENSLKTSKSSYYQLLANNCKPHKNDVLISKDGSVGRTAIVKEERDFVVSSSLVIISPKQDIVCSRYLNYNLKSSYIQERLLLLMHGAGLKRVSIEKNANLPVLLPSLDEQQEIADYLDSKCAAIDTLISKKQQFIDELTAYKKSLIYEYVTGKKEVPA